MSYFRKIEINYPFFPAVSPMDDYLFFGQPLVPLPTLPAFTSDLVIPTGCRSYDLFDSPMSSFHLNRMQELSCFCSSNPRDEMQLRLKMLCDRVSLLETKCDLLSSSRIYGGNRKFEWTTEIKEPVRRKCTWKIEVEDEMKKQKNKKVGKSGGINRLIDSTKAKEISVLHASDTKFHDDDEGEECSYLAKGKKKKGPAARQLVEIEEPARAPQKSLLNIVQGVSHLKQAIVKRPAKMKKMKGKQKELSRQDAALVIQMGYRTYIQKKLRFYRAIRDLAIAKEKYKEIKKLFGNYHFRHLLAHTSEERQRFSDRIIVALLTTESIEDTDDIVRATKKSMISELERILESVDPKPHGLADSAKRRTFDLPVGTNHRGMEHVAEIVQMLNEDDSGPTFEACL